MDVGFCRKVGMEGQIYIALRLLGSNVPWMEMCRDNAHHTATNNEKMLSTLFKPVIAAIYGT